MITSNEINEHEIVSRQIEKLKVKNRLYIHEAYVDFHAGQLTPAGTARVRQTPQSGLVMKADEKHPLQATSHGEEGEVLPSESNMRFTNVQFISSVLKVMHTGVSC